MKPYQRLDEITCYRFKWRWIVHCVMCIFTDDDDDEIRLYVMLQEHPQRQNFFLFFFFILLCVYFILVDYSIFYIVFSAFFNISSSIFTSNVRNLIVYVCVCVHCTFPFSTTSSSSYTYEKDRILQHNLRSSCCLFFSMGWNCKLLLYSCELDFWQCLFNAPSLKQNAQTFSSFVESRVKEKVLAHTTHIQKSLLFFSFQFSVKL